MLNDAIRRAVQIARIVGHKPCFGALALVMGVGADADHLTRFKRDGNNNTLAHIGAPPTFVSAPELKAHEEFVVLHRVPCEINLNCY